MSSLQPEASGTSGAPLLTVITVVKDNLEGLKKTWENLQRQTHQDFEWLVADGDSKDGTQAWLAGISRPGFRYVSRKDRSLWDAMNKAIGEIGTEYCLFLNGGDYFWDERVVERILAAIAEERFEFAYGRWVIGGVPGYPQRERGGRIRSTMEMFYGRVPCHQASVLSRKAFLEMGGYREDIGIYGDREWILRYSKRRPPSTFRYLSFVMVYYDPNGLSYSRFFKWSRTYLGIHWQLGNPLEALLGFLGWLKSSVYILSSMALRSLGRGTAAGERSAT